MSEVLKETEDFRLVFEEEGGFIFLHLEVENWSASVCKQIREALDETLLRFEGGHDVVFGTTSSYKSVRLWNLVKPCFEVVKLDGRNWLGSWLTGKD